MIRLIFPKRKNVIPQDILVMELSEMGSLVLAYTMLKELRQRYPKATIYFLTLKKLLDSVQLLNVFPNENVLCLDNESFLSFTIDSFKVILKLRRLRIDTVLDLELFSRITMIFSYLCGASNRSGFHQYKMDGLYRGCLLTHKVQYNPYIHIGKNYMALLDALEEQGGAPLVKRDYSNLELIVPQFRGNSEGQHNSPNKLKQVCPSLSAGGKIVLFNLSGGEISVRAWPLEHYIRLAQMLLQDSNIYIGVIDISGNRKYFEILKKEISSEKLFECTGMTENIQEVIQLFNCCDVLVTADGGLAHFAALSSMYCVVFFGPETPFLYGPIGPNYTVLYAGLSCSPCVTAYNFRRTSCDGNNICVKQFTPGQVKDIIFKILMNGANDSHMKEVCNAT